MHRTFFLTFGNKNFELQRQRNIIRANEVGWFDDVVCESPETIQDFIAQHKDFIHSNPKGFGYWIWKPYIILKLLEEINEGDLLFFMDAGGCILKHKKARFDFYCDTLTKSEKPIIIFSVPGYKERNFQKIEILKLFDLDKNDSFLESNHNEAGIFMCRKNSETIDFVRQWLNLMVDNNYLLAKDETDSSNQVDGFLCYRNDQSVLSILYKLWGGKEYITEAYGEGPFFSCRMSDNHLKADAPDKFRMREDYNFTSHLFWRDYHSDSQVFFNIINELKSHIIEIANKIRADKYSRIKDELIPYLIPKLDILYDEVGAYSYKLKLYESHPWTVIETTQLEGEIEFYFNLVDKKISLQFSIENNVVEFEQNRNESSRYSIFKIEKIRNSD